MANLGMLDDVAAGVQGAGLAAVCAAAGQADSAAPSALVSEGRAGAIRTDGTFLSSAGRVQRDLTVAAVTAFASMQGLDELVVLDAMSATGLRALRVALEVPACHTMLANDKCAAAHACLEQNVAQHRDALADAGVRVECSCLDASEAMARFHAAGRRIDVIDIDPFGSPMHAVPAALACVRPGGLLSLAFFDLHVLCGSSSDHGHAFSVYGGAPLKLRCAHEVAVRLALASVCRAAAGVGRWVEPMLCAHMQCCVRLLVRVNVADACCAGAREPGNESSDGATGPYCTLAAPDASAVPSTPTLSYIWKCQRCCSWALQGVRCGVALQTKAAECEVCGAADGMELGGPIYEGSLIHAPFLGACAATVEAGQLRGTLASGRQLPQLLSELARELPVALYHHLPSLAQALGVRQPPKRSRVAAELCGRGFACSHSHVAVHFALKTEAPLSVLCDVMRGLCGGSRQTAQKRKLHVREAAAAPEPDTEADAAEMASQSVVAAAAAEAKTSATDAKEGTLNRRQRRMLKFSARQAGAAADAESAGAHGEQCGGVESGEASARGRAEAACLRAGGGARHGVLRVGPQEEEFQDLASAVAVAAHGATILVSPGRYFCNLRLCKTVTIAAARDDGDVDGTCSKPEEGGGDVVLVTAGNKPVLTTVLASSGAKGQDANFEIHVVRCSIEAHTSVDRARGHSGSADGGQVAAVRRAAHIVTVNAGVLQMRGCRIRDGALCSVMVCGTGKLLLAGCQLLPAGGGGVCVSGKGEVLLQGSVISGALGAGLEVRGSGRVLMSRCDISRCGKAGIFCHQSAAVDARACVIARNGFAGVECVGPTAHALVRDCSLLDGSRGGIFVHSNGRAEVRASLVARSAFAGVHVKWGGQLRLEECRVEDGRKVGFLVEGDGSSMHVAACSASGNAEAAPVLAMDGGACVLEAGGSSVPAAEIGTHQGREPGLRYADPAQIDTSWVAPGDVRCQRGGFLAQGGASAGAWSPIESVFLSAALMQHITT